MWAPDSPKWLRVSTTAVQVLSVGLGSNHPAAATSQWQLRVSGIPCREILKSPEGGQPSPGCDRF